ncbi:hypothetical protein B0T24DRAFT_627623 [Lasiosphaeria ovina]|uniref:Uncharacterized protein n=1 Tax=Lasiosphaeria ovina TaxID=92902 RepID=A0AAE0N5J9_9PEZI|nr:hypothetical protein B0T24DRAFT_627623 [Lasiosphaeria ovina]
MHGEDQERGGPRHAVLPRQPAPLRAGQAVADHDLARPADAIRRGGPCRSPQAQCPRHARSHELWPMGRCLPGGRHRLMHGQGSPDGSRREEPMHRSGQQATTQGILADHHGGYWEGVDGRAPVCACAHAACHCRDTCSVHGPLEPSHQPRDSRRRREPVSGLAAPRLAGVGWVGYHPDANPQRVGQADRRRNRRGAGAAGDQHGHGRAAQNCPREVRHAEKDKRRAASSQSGRTSRSSQGQEAREKQTAEGGEAATSARSGARGGPHTDS